MFEHFNFAPALLGGGLIGCSALLLLFTLGRIAGISGITASLMSLDNQRTAKVSYWQQNGWRLLFLLGLIAGAGLFYLIGDQHLPFREPPSTWLIIIAGLLVGFGSHFGSGCTSGHGVCGIGRLSMRSIVATCTFMLSAGITVYIVRHMIG